MAVVRLDANALPEYIGTFEWGHPSDALATPPQRYHYYLEVDASTVGPQKPRSSNEEDSNRNSLLLNGFQDSPLLP
ncbi:uncharacterized protein TrAFT101_005306 [Trichoderma asperellum]|uniref:uncharacterized protein n=1 Tax=Trichoderma asperellum TaxID=101201 RepID=UPI00332CBEDD|nr:hypothetical protein TrAFT101_005306 [Trichoderma asperellum]